jgi:hypothetical protein
MTLTIQCQLCDKEWREKQVIPLENVPDLLQRIAPGEVVPFGECPDPECGGLCHVKEAATNSIAIVWCVDDVKSLRPDLIDEECMEVLNYAARHHDTSLGISWDTLECIAADWFPKKEVKDAQ